MSRSSGAAASTALAGTPGRIWRRATPIVGRSATIQRVLALAEQVAPTNATVLVTGETGTGKECLATFIHESSLRARRPMVRVNCSAIPIALIESELFGREKGAYTGALSKQLGRFEIANGSTLFLDEVGDLPLDVQVKLLRVLQERTIERLGSPQPIDVDVRIIAATNRDLDAAVRGQIPQRPLLPPQRLPDRGAAAPRSARGHPGARHRARRGDRRGDGQALRRRRQAQHRGPAALRLARERAGTAQRARARHDHVAWPDVADRHRAPRRRLAGGRGAATSSDWKMSSAATSCGCSSRCGGGSRGPGAAGVASGSSRARSTSE